jgi:hypothetical protein
MKFFQSTTYFWVHTLPKTLPADDNWMHLQTLKKDMITWTLFQFQHLTWLYNFNYNHKPKKKNTQSTKYKTIILIVSLLLIWLPIYKIKTNIYNKLCFYLLRISKIFCFWNFGVGENENWAESNLQNLKKNISISDTWLCSHFKVKSHFNC